MIILSDLWGEEKSEWLTYYTSLLENHFDVKYYDSCVLGAVDKNEYSEEKLHGRFIDGGVSKAVKNLIKQEKESNVVLGFSIGGYIAWKACNAGLKTQRLVAISATRLRLETQRPSGIIDLIYGEEDTYKPDNSWFEKQGFKTNFYKQEGHELYKKEKIADEICKIITNQ